MRKKILPLIFAGITVASVLGGCSGAGGGDTTVQVDTTSATGDVVSLFNEEKYKGRIEGTYPLDSIIYDSVYITGTGQMYVEFSKSDGTVKYLLDSSDGSEPSVLQSGVFTETNGNYKTDMDNKSNWLFEKDAESTEDGLFKYKGDADAPWTFKTVEDTDEKLKLELVGIIKTFDEKESEGMYFEIKDGSYTLKLGDTSPDADKGNLSVNESGAFTVVDAQYHDNGDVSVFNLELDRMSGYDLTAQVTGTGTGVIVQPTTGVRVLFNR